MFVISGGGGGTNLFLLEHVNDQTPFAEQIPVFVYLRPPSKGVKRVSQA